MIQHRRQAVPAPSPCDGTYSEDALLGCGRRRRPGLRQVRRRGAGEHVRALPRMAGGVGWRRLLTAACAVGVTEAATAAGASAWWHLRFSQPSTDTLSFNVPATAITLLLLAGQVLSNQPHSCASAIRHSPYLASTQRVPRLNSPFPDHHNATLIGSKALRGLRPSPAQQTLARSAPASPRPCDGPRLCSPLHGGSLSTSLSRDTRSVVPAGRCSSKS